MNLRSSHLAATLAALAAASATCPGSVVNIPASQDNTIYSESGSDSNGAGDFIFAGETNQGPLRRALLRFNVAGTVPAGSTINSATLRLHMSKTRSGTDTVDIHRVTASWGEGTSNAAFNEGMGAPATAGDATWTFRFFNTTPWATPGGDFNAAPSATATLGTAIAFYSWTGSGLRTDAQAWLDSPASNFGWMVIGDEANPLTSRRFDSRTNPIAANRPVLIVDYTVPAPASALPLLGLGALLSGRRRHS